ncbi:TrbC family F-type conjugative pilus assembly protein [Modicisalibacter sp. MOD 31.J]|uniref:TrbC family F-type conjugative pilus assembly protein n=1 Tax=Modicisalibacter sp. MOD 31.J TaxID=2831897 RepID=UPI001CCFCA43|nr:TrbC family F-type conjugative pilus assembly protein [Modicisalibacter sp. MOD 31.J]MBZ9574505.1 hypothetical protein [Modicisalibacter sp. MOD 31.J]
MPRFYRRTRLLVAGLGLASFFALPVVALANGPHAAPDPNSPWMQHSKSILEDAVQGPPPKWTQPEVTERQRRWARDIMERTQVTQREGRGEGAAAARAMFPDVKWPEGKGVATPDAIEPDPDATRVFLTLGDDQAGRELFVDQLESLAGRENIQVVLRGLPSGTRRIGELMRVLADITQKIEGAPPVLLDPKRFTKAGVDVAPTVVFYRDGEALARITGSLEIGYLKSRIADGQRGDLGTRGPVYPIAERDLMSVIRDRWANIDWQAQKKKAVKEYWEAYTPTRLPQAEELRETTIDPSIVVARTIRAPNGQVIARKGEHINPLETVPFTGAVIAFDGGSPQQVEVAGRLAEQARMDGLRPILVTQGMPGDAPGFKALERLNQTLGSRVYLLDAQIVDRFDLQSLPAEVRGGETLFHVREVPPDTVIGTSSKGEGDE